MMEDQQAQQDHQSVKRYARFRTRCPKCRHPKLRQVIEIVSAPVYPEDIITTYLS